MKRTICAGKLLLMVCLSLILVMQSTDAFARSGPGRSGDFGRHEEFGRSHRGPAHEVVVVGHERYRYHDGRFYRPTFFGLFEIALNIPMHRPSGYVVVSAPVVVPAPVVLAQVESRKTVTINVPNSNGSYIPITLVEQNGGYFGPQGEYYPGHPTVEQLRVLYGK